MVRKTPKTESAPPPADDGEMPEVPAFLRRKWGAPAADGEAPSEGSADTPARPEDTPPAASGTGSAEPLTAEEALAARSPNALPPEEDKPAPKTRKAKPAETQMRGALGGNSSAALVGLVERIERLKEEAAQTAEDIKEVFGEAKAAGFDTATMRKVLARRRMDPDDLAEMDALIDTYEAALREGR